MCCVFRDKQREEERENAREGQVKWKGRDKKVRERWEEEETAQDDKETRGANTGGGHAARATWHKLWEGTKKARDGSIAQLIQEKRRESSDQKAPTTQEKVVQWIDGEWVVDKGRAWCKGTGCPAPRGSVTMAAHSIAPAERVEHVAVLNPAVRVASRCIDRVDARYGADRAGFELALMLAQRSKQKAGDVAEAYSILHHLTASTPTSGLTAIVARRGM